MSGFSDVGIARKRDLKTSTRINTDGHSIFDFGRFIVKTKREINSQPIKYVILGGGTLVPQSKDLLLHARSA